MSSCRFLCVCFYLFSCGLCLGDCAGDSQTDIEAVNIAIKKTVYSWLKTQADMPKINMDTFDVMRLTVNCVVEGETYTGLIAWNSESGVVNSELIKDQSISLPSKNQAEEKNNIISCFIRKTLFEKEIDSIIKMQIVWSALVSNRDYIVRGYIDVDSGGNVLWSKYVFQ